MQTEVATENTEDSSELEARKRSAPKWRKRFIWLPIILSILMVPGVIALAILGILEPQDFAIPVHADSFRTFFVVVMFSLIFMMPPMLLLAWLVGAPFVYSRRKVFFAVIGAAIGLSIVNGCYWIAVGGFVAIDPPGEPDLAVGVGIGFGALYIMFAVPIAAVVGGALGLIYGWFRK